jgi:DNA-directed RNA polymerase I subunit RPA43
LGGEAAYLEFTVIGYFLFVYHVRFPHLRGFDRLTVANEMLSLLGSLQNDPFSPEHVAERGSPSKTVLGESDIEDIEVEREIEPSPEEEDIEIDTFERLGKMSDKAEAEGRKRKRKGEEKSKVKRKKMSYYNT